MDNIFTSFCMMLQMGFGMPSNACSSTFTAGYINSSTKKEIDESQKILTKKGYIFMNEHRAIVYSTIIISVGIDSYKRKEFQFVTPFEPFANQISVDMTENNKSFKIEWKYNF